MENSTLYYSDIVSKDYEESENITHLYRDSNIAEVYLLVSLSMVSLLGTVGNGLVIWFVVFKMKKTVTSVWFLSLALADFTFSLLLPFYITHLALHHWPFGDFVCYLQGFVAPLNMFSSILQLTVISIDRWACIVFPVWCQNHRTARLAWMVATGVWVLAAGCSVPYTILTNIHTNYIGYVYCWNALIFTIPKETLIMRFILFFIIPLIIIVLCYTVIIVRMRRNRMVTSTKPFRMIAVIIISFIICWLPLHVCHILYKFSSFSFYMHIVLDIVYIISLSLAFANSCVNPFLYVFFGGEFKERFWISIQSALRRAFTEEPDWRDPERHTAQSRALANHDGTMPLYALNVNWT